MIEFPDSPATGDLHAEGGASWRWDGTKWTAGTTGPLLAQGEVIGNPDVADGTGLPTGTATMLRADLGDGVAGQVLTSEGAGLDAAWAGLPGLPVLAQGEVLGTPGATPAAAVAADLALMLRAALGDGTVGQVITSSGTGVDPAWAGLPAAPGLPTLAHAEVLGNPGATSAAAVAAGFALMLRAAFGDGTTGQVITSGGTGIDPAWVGLPAAPGLPTLAHAEVLGNPGSTSAAAVATGFALMLRAAFGDGVAGQALISGGTGVDPAWGVGKYIIGAYAPAAPTASQVLLLHQVSRAVTIPANFATHAGYASKARARVAATASTTINVQRATAAAPSTFTTVGTIVFAAGALTGTFSTSGTAVNYAAGDTLALVAPVTPDTTLAGFSATLVLSET
jgi:hypothetical protein